MRTIALAVLFLATLASGQWLGEKLPLVDTFGIPAGFQSLACNNHDHTVYLSGDKSGSIVVIDAVRAKSIARVAVGRGVRAMCYVPSENKLYCACSQADTVVVLDGTTHQVLARVGFGDSAGSFCYDSVDNKMYVANRGSASVSVLDCSDDRVVTTIDNVHNEFAWLASGMCFTPAHKTVYITSPGDTSVVAIDCSADTALARIPVGTESVALCHNLTNDRVYCRACWAGGGAVYGIDAATNQKVSVVQRGCGSVIACDPVRNVLFVPDDDTLVVVDCSAVAVADEVGPRRDAPTAQRMMHWPIRYTSRTMSRAEGIRESSPSSTVRATQCGSGIGRSMMWMRSVLPTHA